METRNKVFQAPEKENNVLKYAQERGIIFACILIDCFYVSIWVLGVWITNKYIVGPLVLEGFDKIALQIFQWVSGIATLLTLVMFIIRDLIIIAKRILNEIKEIK